MTSIKPNTIAPLDFTKSEDREFMKRLLVTMFRGWAATEQSYDKESGEYKKTDIEAFKEVSSGDDITCQLLSLFGEWSNDIQYLAPHLGVALSRDENNNLDAFEVKDDCPPGNYYWDCKTSTWVEYEG